jgi:hypothetical protein
MQQTNRICMGVCQDNGGFGIVYHCERDRRQICQSAIMAAAAKDPRLKKRTLTDLYDERPTWLKLAHEKLDRAVLAAYAATDAEGTLSEDRAEVWKDTGPGQPRPEGHTLAGKRTAVDQKVLGNLLRLNQERSNKSPQSQR